MNTLKKRAFTLVELIVVVTILAILATIGFVSYSSYLTGVRDTNRLSQLVSIHDGLELYRTTKDLPLPDDYIEIKGSGSLVAYQGYAGSNVLETIDFTKGGKDPKDGSYFSYYLTKDRKFFQMMAFLEEEESLSSQTSPLLRGIEGELVHATDYSERVPSVYGKKLGILTDSSNTPVQEISSVITAGEIDFDGSGTEYVAHVDDSTTINSNGITALQGTFLYTVGKSNRDCKEIIEKNPSTLGVDGDYWISPDGAEDIKVYCDMTTEGGGWTLVLNGIENDIELHDYRGTDLRNSTGAILYSGYESTFKFSDDDINFIRNDGIYMLHGNSDVATEGRFYVASTCKYNHIVGEGGTTEENGDCGEDNTIFTDVALSSNVSCNGNAQYRGIGYWGPVITNYTGSSGDNSFCYNNGGGWCANHNIENIKLRMYVR